MAYFNPSRLLGIGCLAAMLALPAGAIAAESYGNCKGFIDSLPATIGTQGVWCLRKDLSTAQASGAAITIAANNVTVDCNDYKVGGLSAGPDTEAVGAYIPAERLNAVVRGCSFRGFHVGIVLHGAGGRIENNRISGSRAVALQVTGDNALIQGNLVTETGNSPGLAAAVGIWAMGGGARVLDNDIHGVSAEWVGIEGIFTATGIEIATGFVARNRISGVETPPPDSYNKSAGIRMSNSIAEGNDLAAQTNGYGYAIVGDGESSSVCARNMIAGFPIGAVDCASVDNVYAPSEFGPP